MNNNPVMSVQGSGKKLIMIGIGIVILAIFLTIYIGSYAEGSRNEDVLAVFVFILGYGGIAAGIFTIIIGRKYSKSHISVYEDRIQGEGLIKFSIGTFVLKYDNITSALANENKLLINSCGVIYKIGIDTYNAQRIASYISNKK